MSCIDDKFNYIKNNDDNNNVLIIKYMVSIFAEIFNFGKSQAATYYKQYKNKYSRS